MNKKLTPKEKAEIAFSAKAGEQTYAQIASKYQVDNRQISTWKQMLEKEAPKIFADKRKTENKKQEQQDLIDNLYKIIGQRDLELDWLKKKLCIIDSS